MSVPEQADVNGRGAPVSDIVAGFLAAAAVFAGAAALVYYPMRIGLAGIIIALIATGMGGGIKQLTALAMVCAAGGFFFGMVIAVLLDQPLF